MKHIFYLLFSITLFLNVGYLSGQQKVETKDKVETKEATVYVTKTGSKYHSSNCGYLHSCKIAMPLNQAKLSYGACSRCNGSPSYKPKSNTTKTRDQTSYPSKSTTVQCSGTKQAGNRCKRRTTNANGRCYQH